VKGDFTAVIGNSGERWGSASASSQAIANFQFARDPGTVWSRHFSNECDSRLPSIRFAATILD
jgi:hypothetical protein